MSSIVLGADGETVVVCCVEISANRVKSAKNNPPMLLMFVAFDFFQKEGKNSYKLRYTHAFPGLNANAGASMLRF